MTYFLETVREWVVRFNSIISEEEQNSARGVSYDLIVFAVYITVLQFLIFINRRYSSQM